jgi:hypothetical protein
MSRLPFPNFVKEPDQDRRLRRAAKRAAKNCILALPAPPIENQSVFPD